MDLCSILKCLNITQYCVVPIHDEFIIYPHKLRQANFKHNTAIVCLFSYYSKNYPKDAVLTRFASCPDYHKVVGNILKIICETLTINYPGYNFIYYTDNSPYCEKDLAESGGLIIRGKNDIGLSKKYGQFFFIGEIVTDAALPYEYRTPPSCCKDAPCIKACPTGAISENGFLRERCLSYISQKSGSEFSEEDKNYFKFAKYAWGCDICLNACVKNKILSNTLVTEFLNINPYISVDDINDLSSREYKEKYHDRVFSGRSKSIMLRNLLHLKENT